MHHGDGAKGGSGSGRVRRGEGIDPSGVYRDRGGLSATGDIFDAIARRAGTTVAAAVRGAGDYRGGQTGLLRLTWDNGDRTVLVNPELGGVTLGWNLTHTAQDELFAAIEGTAFHTRVILRADGGAWRAIRRVINGGGIPQKNETLNRVYANVLNKPVLVPEGDVTSLGSAIMAFMAAGAFETHRSGAAGGVPALAHRRAGGAAIAPRTSSCTRVYRKLYFAWASRIPRQWRSARVLPE